MLTQHTSRGNSTATTTLPLCTGDGWSSRVLDAAVHGCVPVVLQDESEMFFEGSFAAAGLPFDYANFSLRLPEVELPRLLLATRNSCLATCKLYLAPWTL